MLARLWVPIALASAASLWACRVERAPTQSGAPEGTHVASSVPDGGPRGEEGTALSTPTPKDAGVAHVWELYGPLKSGKCKVIENPTCPPEFEICIIRVPETECPAGAQGHGGKITQELGGSECTLRWEEFGDTSCPAGHLCSPPQVLKKSLRVACPP